MPVMLGQLLHENHSSVNGIRQYRQTCWSHVFRHDHTQRYVSSPWSTGKRAPVSVRNVLQRTRVPVPCTQPEINAENFLASTARAKHKVGWLHVSMNDVTEHESGK